MMNCCLRSPAGVLGEWSSWQLDHEARLWTFSMSFEQCGILSVLMSCFLLSLQNSHCSHKALPQNRWLTLCRIAAMVKKSNPTVGALPPMFPISTLVVWGHTLSYILYHMWMSLLRASRHALLCFWTAFPWDFSKNSSFLICFPLIFFFLRDPLFSFTFPPNISSAERLSLVLPNEAFSLVGSTALTILFIYTNLPIWCIVLT